MKKTKIILGMPSHSNFAKPIIENLQYHNFEVEFIDSSPEHVKNINVPFYAHFIHFLRRVFFRDNTYKKKVKTQIKNQLILKAIQTQLHDKQFDYSLVIRPDLFLAEHLKQIKQHTTYQFSGYQWNGLNRFQNTIPLISLFDRFFVFDSEDLVNSNHYNLNLLGTTNFYFNMYKPKPITHQGIVAYFVGLHFDERSETINRCAHQLIEHGVILDFNIKLRSDKQKHTDYYQVKQIKNIKDNIEFGENIYRINCADILVDVVNPVHNGLSFRTFEALYYEKKLITNNSSVQNYDFYHPDNIFIWNSQDLSGLSEFLGKPFISINSTIIQKYSFINWIKYILDMPPYFPVTLPSNFLQSEMLKNHHKSSDLYDC